MLPSKNMVAMRTQRTGGAQHHHSRNYAQKGLTADVGDEHDEQLHRAPVLRWKGAAVQELQQSASGTHQQRQARIAYGRHPASQSELLPRHTSIVSSTDICLARDLSELNGDKAHILCWHRRSPGLCQR